MDSGINGKYLSKCTQKNLLKKTDSEPFLVSKLPWQLRAPVADQVASRVHLGEWITTGWWF
jgi:hypothetical protein